MLRSATNQEKAVTWRSGGAWTKLSLNEPNQAGSHARNRKPAAFAVPTTTAAKGAQRLHIATSTTAQTTNRV